MSLVYKVELRRSLDFDLFSHTDEFKSSVIYSSKYCIKCSRASTLGVELETLSGACEVYQCVVSGVYDGRFKIKINIYPKYNPCFFTKVH